MYHLATCLVNYLGHRVIAQSIIPGILNNQDLANLAEYGTVDEKKNIVANEEFHKLMTQVADALNLKTTKVIDPVSGDSVELAGSVEVKGIRGADKRAYIVDLQGLTPRDANYLGADNHTCLLRHEIVSIYQHTKNMEYATAKMKDFTKELESKRPQDFYPQKDVEMTEEIKLRNQKLLNEESIAKIKEVDRLLKEAPTIKYNANVFKENIKLDMTQKEIESDENDIKKLSEFLLKEQIPALIRKFKSGENVPTDSESLQEILHKSGINMRYLGELHRAVSA